MAPVNDQPFLNYVLRYLGRNEIKRIILATSYLHEKIEDYYGNRYEGMALEYSIEKEPLGTGGGLRQAFDQANSKNILVINGDTFFDADLAKMRSLHLESNADFTLALKAMQDIWRYGVVKTDASRVISFAEKARVAAGDINAGVYLARKDLFDRFDLPARFSLEEDFLKKFTKDLNIQAYISDAYFIDIGIPEDYERAQTEMRKYE